MIISASRRTDIPGFFSQWFLQRLRAGSLLVPNPWNPKQVGKVRLSPDNVDCIVFWTKNARPMLDKLSAMDAMGYKYYFSFTITPYGRDVEQNLPPKNEVMETFRELSDRLGPKRVDWRFDPIAVTERHPVQWHFDAFGRMCERLKGYTERCIINFVKAYRHIAERVNELDGDVIVRIARGFAGIAAEHRLPLFNCTEKWDLREAGIQFSACIDKEKIESVVGYSIGAKKDPGQPKICHCLESFDVGMYETCTHGCVYCYAQTNFRLTFRKAKRHDPGSPMLIGLPARDSIINDRTRASFRSRQLSLFRD